MYSRTVIAFSLIGLAACGGGGGGGGAAESPSFDAMYSNGEGLIQRLKDAEPTAVMPTSGGGTYRGVAGFAPDEYSDAEVMSQVRLEASFADGAISGEFHNFRDYDNERIPGAVKITSVDGIEGAGYLGSLSGTLAGEEVIGNLAGAFINPGANATMGFTEGMVGGKYFVGVYGAER